ncbi:MAG: YwaF family protein [Clostridia bacterium]|nr:YwaF family protein [Clostridia bacterium]
MFYLFTILVLAMLIGGYVTAKCLVKNKENFSAIIAKTLKITVVVYCVIIFLSIFLPDAFALCINEENLVLDFKNISFAIVRWFTTLSFIMLPLAVFYKNRTIRNIAIYFCSLMTLISMFYYPVYLEAFTSTAGRGLNSISVLSPAFKNFLINPVFRSFVLGLTIVLGLSIPVVLAVEEKHLFNVKNVKEWLNFGLVLVFSILGCMPIYVPQHLFGYSNIIFEAWTLPHLFWLLSVIAEIVALYFIFRKKDAEVKHILCLVLSLSLVLQYNQMFSAISINIERLPLQLCNIGSFLVLFSLIFKNKVIFNFTVIVNVVGVLFALAMPDLDGKGLFYLYNMHFILEHTNVIVVPILALLFGLFPRLDKKALKHYIIGFVIYFVVVLLLGAIFNAIALSTGNDFWKANYLFMFDQEKAAEFIGFMGALFNPAWRMGKLTFYPLMHLTVFFVFNVLCLIVFFMIQLVYIIKDKIYKNKSRVKVVE